jgi:hypothetical protein
MLESQADLHHHQHQSMGQGVVLGQQGQSILMVWLDQEQVAKEVIAQLVEEVYKVMEIEMGHEFWETAKETHCLCEKDHNIHCPLGHSQWVQLGWG